jgi:estrogen-related receptor beta like 1
MWENSLEKLKILNYEESFCAPQSRKPFNRVYFAMPSNNASHQFDDFMELCSWLCQEISNNSDLFQRDQFDDPNTAANKLMLALRSLDFRLSFPSQKLKTPHGENVCNVLEFLTDSALRTKGFKWGTPVYTEADDAERADVDDDERDEDEVEDEAGHGIEEDVLFEEADRVDAVETALDSSAHNIMQPAIDPIEWKTELERVGPKLKAQQQLSTNEWRAHVDQTSVSKEAIEKVLGEAQTDLAALNRYVTCLHILSGHLPNNKSVIHS